MRDTDDISAYDFELPDDRIATHPARPRSASRMLVVPPEGPLTDRTVADLPELVRPGDLVIVNDARVTPARLRGHRVTGGAVEVFVVGLGAEGRWDAPRGPLVAMTRSNRRLSVGERVLLGTGEELTVLDRRDDGTTMLAAPEGDVFELLSRAGEMPLPPYISKRRAELGEAVSQPADAADYQTVFASREGAVAAPTAGLHFDEALVGALRAAGAMMARVTLTVGAGTFAPVRADRLSEHHLHAEHYAVSEETAQAIADTRAAGGRVIAVGTTVVRTLESAASGGGLRAGPGTTALFVRPGFRFGVVDALLTNFHLPRSTLLALVCAFGGYDRVMGAYTHAVGAGYRFYSYGDAMFLPSKGGG